MSNPEPDKFDAALPQILEDFVSVTNKAKVAVIIPLFGYWMDAKSDQLDARVLSVFLDRIYSRTNDVFLYVLGETDRIPKDVAQVLISKAQGGNYQGIHMDSGSTYAQYVSKGLEVALSESKAAFISIANPWVLIQHGGLDTLINRANMNDEAKVICGYDIKMDIKPEEFEGYRPTYPKEMRGITFDFCMMARQTAEILQLDAKFITHSFLERDAWQTMFTRGYEAISSQKVPIFSFDVDWKELESFEDFIHDQQYFTSKWSFDPAIKYGEKA